MTCPRLLLGLLAFAAVASGQTNLAGGWIGTFDRPGPSRHLLLVEFANTPEGMVGAAEISAWASAAPLHSIRIKETQVTFAAETNPGRWSFLGNVSGDNTAIEGTVTLGPDQWPFRLKRDAYPLGLLASSAESLGEFDDGFVGRWYSMARMSDGAGFRFVLRRTVHGLTAQRECWKSGDRLHRIKIAGNSIRFELPNETSAFAVLNPEDKYSKRTAPAMFEGVLHSDGMRIRGVWSEGGEEQPFMLNRQLGEGLCP